MKQSRVLATAAAAGDTARVSEMLKGEPVLARDWQPIMEACFYGHPGVVRLLLAHGADPNVMSKSTYRYRPLHRTVEHKQGVKRGPQHLHVAEALVEAGADAMARGRWDMVTAIAVAAMGGETQFLPLLLAAAPEPDLFTAAVLGDLPRVASLLRAEPSLASARDENGWQALDYCARTRVAAGDPEREAALVTMARLLLDGGADPAQALGPAVGTNHAEMVDLLLQRGAVIDSGDALAHAAEAENFAALDVLVRYGVDLQCTRGTEHHGGYTPLGCLMTIRSARGARWFLEQGIDPNRVGGERGETALHVAVRYGCAPDTLRLLAEHGVEVNARDSEGKSALELARAAGREKAVRWLESVGAAE